VGSTAARAERIIVSMTTSTKTKRPYFRRADRRRLLLETAAEVVESEGWTALTMSAIAERGGTSRQLVYQHFPNLETLLSKTAWHIFTDVIENTRQSVAGQGSNIQQAIAAAEKISLDLPTGRADALWALIAGTAGNSPELDTMRRGIRDLILKIWQPIVRDALQVDSAEARTVAWSLVMGFWGMRQMVRDGDITREEGVTTFNTLVARLLS